MSQQHWINCLFSIQAFCNLEENKENDLSCLSEDQYNVAVDVTEVFYLPHLLSKHMQSDKPKISKVVYIVDILSQFLRVLPPMKTKKGDVLKKRLEFYVSKYESEQKSFGFYVKCAFLDSSMNRYDIFQKYNPYVMELFDELVLIRSGNKPVEKKVDSDGLGDFGKLQERIDSLSLGVFSTANHTSNSSRFDALKDNETTMIFNDVLHENMDAVLGHDPLIWWKDREKMYPTWSILARKYLCVSCTSCGIERLFKHARDIADPGREKMEEFKFSRNVFLRENHEMIVNKWF